MWTQKSFDPTLERSWCELFRLFSFFLECSVHFFRGPWFILRKLYVIFFSEHIFFYLLPQNIWHLIGGDFWINDLYKGQVISEWNFVVINFTKKKVSAVFKSKKQWQSVTLGAIYGKKVTLFFLSLPVFKW